jgi:DNA recombination protein RmuC
MEPVSVLLGVFVGATAAGVLALLRSRRTAGEAAASQERARGEEARRVDAEARASREAERAAAALGELAGLRERLQSQQAQLEAQLAFVEKTKKESEAVFQAAAAKALETGSRQFLELAQQRLATSQSEAESALEERKVAIETLLLPLQERLATLAKRTEEVEQSRTSAYSDIKVHVEQLRVAATAANAEASKLTTALRGTQVRGWWGEQQLENLVEWAGLLEHCDFCKQQNASDSKRPDLTIHLPGGRKLAVDSKAIWDSYLASIDCTTDGDRYRAMDAHVAAIRSEMKALAARDYDSALGGGVDLVVMFLPADPVLGAALAHDPRLQEDAYRLHILLASPTNFLAILSTAAVLHQQAGVAENAAEIAKTARDLYDRTAMLLAEHLAGVRRGLEAAMNSFNRAVGTLDHEIRPMERRLKEMKVVQQPKRELMAPPPIEIVLRDVRAELPVSVSHDEG